MNGTSPMLPVQVLPQQQAPHLSPASISCFTILSSHFQPGRLVQPHSSHTIRPLPQRGLLLDNKLQDRSFCVKHFPSSFHGDARAGKEEKLKDACNSYPTREPRRAVEIPSVRPFGGAHRPPGNYSSPVTQLPCPLEPRFPSASVDQIKTRDLSSPGNSDHNTSSTLEVVQPGWKSSSELVPTVSTITEHRRPWRAEKRSSDLRASSPNNGPPGSKVETSHRPGIRRLLDNSNRNASRNANPNCSKQTETGVESKNVISNQTVRRSPDGGAHLLSKSHATQMSYGKSRSRVEPAYRVVDQARSSQNGAHPALVKHRHMHSAGTTSEAIAALQNRLHLGVTTDSSIYSKVLQMCLQQKDLLAARQVHDCIIEGGMDKNPYVATNLLNGYIKCGGLLDARRVFDEFEKKNVMHWSSMIAGYAKSGHAESAFELFKLMRQEGPRPNEVTFLSALKACTSPSALTWGKDIHLGIQHAGFESDVRVGTALIQMYSKCGCITEARRVFEKLTNRNCFTWNVMIGAYAENGFGVEAYRLFLQMSREGFEPDAFTYTRILNTCASADAMEWLNDVHGQARKVGLDLDLRVGSAFVHMYANAGCIDEARQVFDRMEKRDVVTWTVMIGGLAQHGCGPEAYGLFLQMRREGFEPDAVTIVTILNSSASEGALEWVKEVHDHARKVGLESDLRVGNGLVHMYAKSGSIDDARMAFAKMKQRDVVSWTIMIGALAQHGCGHEAYRLFLQMRREGFEPNAFTYTSILNAAASDGALEWVKDVHSHSRKAGLESNIRLGNALVHMYAESGSIEHARLVFDRMDKRDVVTWNVMIGGLAHHGCGNEVLALFRKMNGDLVKPDRTTFVAVLSACCHAGLVDDGRRLFSAMARDYGIEPDIVHYGCMVDLLGRAGRLEEAKVFISDMPVEPDRVTWTALLGACTTYGNVELGELAANKLFKLEPSGGSTYVLLSNIYAAAGEWEKKALVRAMMKERGIQKEPGRSWIEVDNKIHEFVVGDTFHPEAKAIYAELKTLNEKLKAEGYIPDTRLVLHDINEEDKELALCSHSEKLAIVYGLMHLPREEPIRVRKNLRVCSDCHTATKLISKVTGHEIIARDASRFHHFKDGVCSCGDYW